MFVILLSAVFSLCLVDANVIGHYSEGWDQQLFRRIDSEPKFCADLKKINRVFYTETSARSELLKILAKVIDANTERTTGGPVDLNSQIVEDPSHVAYSIGNSQVRLRDDKVNLMCDPHEFKPWKNMSCYAICTTCFVASLPMCVKRYPESTLGYTCVCTYDAWDPIDRAFFSMTGPN